MTGRHLVEVDPTRGDAVRMPLLADGPSRPAMGDPVALAADPSRTGRVGWDPSLGWVVVLDQPWPLEERTQRTSPPESGAGGSHRT